MTSGIYSIEHIASGKRYVGKSTSIEDRLWWHAWALRRIPRKKDCNRHLWNAVQKHGWDAFRSEVLEEVDPSAHDILADREIFWMDFFNTCDRTRGYNLRRDSSTRTEVHPETRRRLSDAASDILNPNYGNRWDDEQRARMSRDAIARHAAGRYGAEWRKRIAEASTRQWADHEKRLAMGKKVSVAKQKYQYEQIDRETGEVIRVWNSVADIVENNPGFAWQCIYSVCHGHKKTYRGFAWRQIPKDSAV